jgi:hypothetical protein
MTSMDQAFQPFCRILCSSQYLKNMDDPLSILYSSIQVFYTDLSPTTFLVSLYTGGKYQRGLYQSNPLIYF